MPTIYSESAGDGYISASSPSSWLAASRATTGLSFPTFSASGFSTGSARFPGRGGGYIWVCSRNFFHFDTSSITSTLSSATLTITSMGSFDTCDFYVVKSTHNDTLANGDFDAITGWDNSAEDNTDNVTKYSAKITSWNPSIQENEIELNATALADIKNNDDFKICMIESDYDLNHSDPAGYYRLGNYYADNSGTAKDPKLTLVVATVTDNVIFFGTNF